MTSTIATQPTAAVASSSHRRPALTDRLGAACGAVYVIGILVGNQITSGGGEVAHPTGAKDLQDFHDAAHSTTDLVGRSLEVTGFLAFAFFLAWLVHSLRERGGAAAWLAGAAGIAGTTTLAVKLASFMPMSAGILNRDAIDPTTARVLTDMNGAAFAVTLVTFAGFMLAVGLAVLTSGFLGRVAGWTAVLSGAAGVVLTLAVRIDPTSINPIPFLLGLLWILVTGIRLAWTGPRAAAA